MSVFLFLLIFGNNLRLLFIVGLNNNTHMIITTFLMAPDLTKAFNKINNNSKKETQKKGKKCVSTIEKLCTRFMKCCFQIKFLSSILACVDIFYFIFFCILVNKPKIYMGVVFGI